MPVIQNEELKIQNKIRFIEAAQALIDEGDWKRFPSARLPREPDFIIPPFTYISGTWTNLSCWPP